MESTMAWTEITRAYYRRDELRYASDLKDLEWAVIEPLLPSPSPLGRPRAVDLRAVMNAILYLLVTGCQWRALPKDFPPRSTVQGYFYRWRNDCTWQWINDALVRLARRSAGRKPTASTGIIDSQSAPTTESGGPRGIDAGKRVKGRKRHIVTDSVGNLLAVQVHEANIQDPHGAVPLLRALRRRFPRLGHIFADRIYRGQQLRNAIADCGPWSIEIVERPPGVKGFQLLPRRWVVERTFAWLGRNRRLAKDFEATIASATAWLILASIRLLSRRLARA
jgi:putative transposase